MLFKLTVEDGRWYHHLLAIVFNAAMYAGWALVVGTFVTKSLTFWDIGNMDFVHISMSTFMVITAQLVFQFVTDKV